MSVNDQLKKELSTDELGVLKIVQKGLASKIGQSNSVTVSAIVTGLKTIDCKVGNTRIRKVINVIRKYGLVRFLISKNSGYYVASSREEVIEYIEGLKKREEGINQIRTVLENQIKEYDKIKSKNGK